MTNGFYRNLTTAASRALLVCLLGAAALFAQAPSGQITGRVTDASEAVVPGAAVTVIDEQRKIERTTRSNETGYYRVPLLEAGTYRVAVVKDGFQPVTRAGVALEVGQVIRLDFTLKIGTISESVTVTGEAALLQSETTDVGQVIDSKRVLEMPLNGRNYLELARFTVGVLPAGTYGGGQRQAAEGQFIAAGMHGYQNSVLLDGADNSSRYSGGAIGYEAQVAKPAVDSVAEFRVVTNNMSAEFGYRMGAKVLVSTRSGNNALHGSAYEFLRNDKLDGSNFFANRSGVPKPPYRQNQFGGTAGGPVIRNRTFFFASYQATRIRLGGSSITSVPSQDAVRGDFSQQPATQRNIFDPLTLTGTAANAVRLPFPGNRIPTDRFDPVAKNVLALYPAPNIAGRDNLPNNYYYGPSDPTDGQQFDMRLDHNFSAAHAVFGRYSLRKQNSTTSGTLPPPAVGNGGQTTDLTGHNLALNDRYTVGPSAVNEFRFGFSRLDSLFGVLYSENYNQKLGIKGAPGDTIGDGLDQGMSNFAVTNFSQLGGSPNWPQMNNLTNWMAADSLMMQKGRHSIKVGGEYRHGDILRIPDPYRRGAFTYNGTYTAQKPNDATSRSNTGNSAADLLLGWSYALQYGNAGRVNTVTPYYGFFFQDDWKVTPRLTINAGLRWELFQRPVFPDPNNQTISRYLIPEVNGIPASQEGLVFPKDGSDCGCRQAWHNFGPRLGIAWQLNRNTVLRVGGGRYFGEHDDIEFGGAAFAQGPPKLYNITNTQARETTQIVLKGGLPPLPASPGLPANANVYVASDYLPNMSAAQWFFDVQRNLPAAIFLTLGYNGSSSSHLEVQRNLNVPYTPDATVQASARRPRPQLNQVTLFENSLGAGYQAVTAKTEKRFSKGLTFLNSFTWSHNIDYASELNAVGTAITFYRQMWRERGNSALDRRFTFVSSFLYELPFGPNKALAKSGAARWLLSGWQVGGILSLMSGTPLTNTINVDNQNTGGNARGDWLRNPNLPADQRTIDRWFDTGFVVPSKPGVIGNAGRNLIYGPHTRNFDLVLRRDFRLPWEGHHLEFRFESFNLTNTPSFYGPNVAVGTPAAGTITGSGQPRRNQFALKYAF
jgi:hypothetical protein